jgi:CheY-like chemotaxis protein
MTKITRPAGSYRILIVDDSKLESSEYRDALLAKCASKIEVVVCNGVNEAVAKLDQDGDWDIIVLDMMMVHDGSQLDLELTKDGKFSGAVLAKRVRCKVGDVPIILLSNCTFKEVREACEQTESIVTNCVHWQKPSLSPAELATKLDQFFKSGSLKKDSGLLARIFGALLFQPNIAGVGVDVKKLFE